MTLAFSLRDEQMSAEELRRITFAVRINRPMSLFARCWLLVKGETEIWLLSELASICGYSLRGEGVRVIEFAQCGAVLIKAARDPALNGTYWRTGIKREQNMPQMFVAS